MLTKAGGVVFDDEDGRCTGGIIFRSLLLVKVVVVESIIGIDSQLAVFVNLKDIVGRSHGGAIVIIAPLGENRTAER